MPEAASSETARTVLRLPLEPQSCAKARTFVTSVLTDWGMPEELVRDAVLVANELVANAVEHGAGPIWFGLTRTESGIRLESGDGTAEAPRMRNTGPTDERHRSLVVVSALSTGWGTEVLPEGKVVWVRMSA